MARSIPNLSVAGLVKFGPEDFNDSESDQIKMGKAEAFKDEPITEVKTVADKYPTYERLAFTPRLTLTPCSDTPEVAKIKAIMGMRKRKAKPPSGL